MDIDGPIQGMERDPLVRRSSLTGMRSVAVVTLIACAIAVAALGVALYTFIAPTGPNLCDIEPMTCRDQADFDADVQRSAFDTVLCVVAHPDDIEFNGGGTVARWVNEGKRVHYLIITNGDKGTRNASEPPAEVAARRQQEQLQAARILGVSSVTFLNQTDGLVTNSVDLRRNITRVVRTLRPQLIMTWNPYYFFPVYNYYLDHLDHQTTGAAVLATVYPEARDDTFYPELQLPGWKVSQVWLYNWRRVGDGSDQFVDISAVMDQKIAAMMAHASQVDPGTPALLRTLAARLGRPLGWPYAEWFTRVVMPL